MPIKNELGIVQNRCDHEFGKSKGTHLLSRFFPAFLWEPNGNTILQFYVLGGTFMVVSFITFSSIALLAGSISNYLKTRKSVGVVLKWLQILVFVGIAVYILIP
jgi:hypothetical protein